MAPSEQEAKRSLYLRIKRRAVKTWRTMFWTIVMKLRGDSRGFAVPTQLTVHERVMLYLLAVRQPWNCTIVEIGSYLGASACFLAAGARRRQGRVFCVDTWENDAMPEERRDTFQESTDNGAPFAFQIEAFRGR